VKVSPRASRAHAKSLATPDAASAFNGRGVISKPSFKISRNAGDADICLTVVAHEVEPGSWIAESGWMCRSHGMPLDMTPLHRGSKRFKTKSEAVENAMDRAIVMVSRQSHRQSQTADWTSKIESLRSWLPALQILEAKDRLKLISGPQRAFGALIEAWAADKTPLASKTIVAATRAEVAELNQLARAHLVATGVVADHLGIDIEIIHRDDTTETKRFAPGDRIVFTKNDKALGVSNGVCGLVTAVKSRGSAPSLTVELDDANERAEKTVEIPAAFGRFDLSACLTNHKAQGRTFDSAYVLANPSMADREWTYVAASRSRFATTVFVNASALGLVDPESHGSMVSIKHSRAKVIEALAARMRRSRAKGTTLDYDDAPNIRDEGQEPYLVLLSKTMAAQFIAKIRHGRNQLREMSR
jgi:hypothetical protein